MAVDTGFSLGRHMKFLVAVVWITENKVFLTAPRSETATGVLQLLGLYSADHHVSQATKSALRSNESDAGCAVTTHRDLYFQELCVQEQDTLIMVSGTQPVGQLPNQTEHL